MPSDNFKIPPLTPEEIAMGVTLTDIPVSELAVEDISDKHVEKMARGFILGKKAIGRRKEVRAVLEKKVTERIGKKGKYLVDKLFELIDGVYVVDKMRGDMSTKGSEIRYYKTPPSLPAIIYALDRVLGKPAAKVEKSEEKQGLILVQHVITNMANNPYKNGKRIDRGPVRDGGVGPAEENNRPELAPAGNRGGEQVDAGAGD